MTDLSQFTHLDTTKSLYNPSVHELTGQVDVLLSSGLWKIGGCFEDQLGVRPRHATHYNPQYFDRNGAILIAHGLDDKAHAEQLETAGIQRAKFDLHTGVNTKSRDGVPHDGYSPVRPGALYAVPVRPDVATTQHEFHQVHVSYHKRKAEYSAAERAAERAERAAERAERAKEKRAAERAERAAERAERAKEKRAKMLDKLIDAIPMQQLQRAFKSPTSTHELVKLQVKHNINKSNTQIYMELRALFDERY